MKTKILFTVLCLLSFLIVFSTRVNADAPGVRGHVIINGANYNAPAGTKIYWRDRLDYEVGQGFRYTFIDSNGYFEFPSWQESVEAIEIERCGATYPNWSPSCYNSLIEGLKASDIISKGGWFNIAMSPDYTAPDASYLYWPFGEYPNQIEYRGHWECEMVNMYNTGQDCYQIQEQGIMGSGFGCWDNGHRLRVDFSTDPMYENCECVKSFRIGSGQQNEDWITKDLECSCSINNDSPTVTVNADDICSNPHMNQDITIIGRDEDGADTIRAFLIDIYDEGNNKVASAKVNDGGGMDVYSGTFIQQYCYDSQIWCEDVGAKTVQTILTPTFLKNGEHKIEVTVIDDLGATGETSDFFLVKENAKGNIYFDHDDEEMTIGESTEIIWTSEYADGGNIFCELNGEDQNPFLNVSIDMCYPPDNPVLNGSSTFTPLSEGNYKVTFLPSNDCGGVVPTDEITVVKNVPAVYPWLMTSWGDTFASGGYALETQEVTDMDKVPSILDYSGSSKEYFSNYIRSWESGNNFIGSDKWTLGGYTDSNVGRWYSSQPNSVYDLFKELASKNGYGSYEGSWYEDGVHIYENLTIDSGDCDGHSLTFVSGDLEINSPIRITNPDADLKVHGCVFIVVGDIIVGDLGDATMPEYDEINGYFITGSQFKTESDGSDGVLIKGGVIEWQESFQRNVEDGGRPSEGIYYDPRYFEIMREYLGQDYSYSVRETGY